METEGAAHRYALREQVRIRNLIDLIPKGDASLLDGWHERRAPVRPHGGSL